MNQEHPFAQYVRILGRGKNVSRSLKFEEAEAAMSMILEGNVMPEQLGAFLMLLRIKEETPEEIAGFVQASKNAFDIPQGAADVDLDWSSYAGKKRQLPWFILSALALADSGVKIFMHGAEGHTPGRLYTRQIMQDLGLPVVSTLTQATSTIAEQGLAFMPLADLSPKLEKIINLRPILGLRSPVHTIARMLNPLNAPYMMQGIFHVGYMDIHQGAAQILNQPHMAVFRGEGGEIERRPNKSLDVKTVHAGEMATEEWPPMLPEPRQPIDKELNVARLQSVWRGDEEDTFVDAAVTGTIAIVLKMMQKASSIEEATALSEQIWLARNRQRIR